ncbi:CbtA family protein [Amycolatopsis thermoflava]|uniref:CbtA family protein n=1 Tax=Amycolatopsis thermoflava TaxID=84480 RepID=UPI00382541ED
MSLLSSLGRGLLAGGGAGLLSGAFSWWLAEPVLDRAVELESARQAAANVAQSAEVFGRATQHAGLLFSATVSGLAFGVLFGVVYALLQHKQPGDRAWSLSLRLAGAGFLAVELLPFLRYPGNPPGVGDPATVSLRANAWLTAIGVSIVFVVAAWQLNGHLRRRGVPDPLVQLVCAGVVVAGLATLFLLPDSPDPVAAPASLVWDFRLLSLASLALLWAALGAGFGLLAERDRGRLRFSPVASSGV